MTTEALKSTPITNLDATPITPNTAGQGAPGHLRSVNGHVTTTAGVTTGSTYKLVRFPTNAKVKQLLVNAVALGGSTAFDIDVAYSDSTVDGTSAANQGTIVQVAAADNKLFGAALSFVSALVNVDKTFAGTFTTENQNQEMWAVLGLASDPGGMFDIVLKSTATNTNGGDVSVELRYVE